MSTRAFLRAPAVPVFVIDGAVRPLVVRRVARARRIGLRVDTRLGEVRLSLPTRAALAPALAWVEEKRGWIEARIAARPQRVALGPGASFMLEGRTVSVIAGEGERGVVLDGGAVRVGGPPELAPARLVRWLKARALERLRAETLAMAATAGVTVGRVGVGDPRTRWGSCSAAGDIRYSWRLILAPPEVRVATVAHEVAHRLHMDHSPAFHAAHARLLGRDPAPERAWLRVHGAALHAVGRA